MATKQTELLHGNHKGEEPGDPDSGQEGDELVHEELRCMKGTTRVSHTQAIGWLAAGLRWAITMTDLVERLRFKAGTHVPVIDTMAEAADTIERLNEQHAVVGKEYAALLAELERLLAECREYQGRIVEYVAEIARLREAAGWRHNNETELKAKIRQLQAELRQAREPK